MTNDPMTTIKKYKLKPGNHQFAPKSHATHNNNNLTDAEAEWYLERYPHIASLFVPESTEEIIAPVKQKARMKANTKQINNVEPLTPPSGGWGATK